MVPVCEIEASKVDRHVQFDVLSGRHDLQGMSGGTKFCRNAKKELSQKLTL